MYLVLNYTIDYHTRVLNNKSFEANDLDILVVKLYQDLLFLIRLATFIDAQPLYTVV